MYIDKIVPAINKESVLKEFLNFLILIVSPSLPPLKGRCKMLTLKYIYCESPPLGEFRGQRKEAVLIF
jgi:hypothetical protein